MAKQITYAQGLALTEIVNEYSAYSIPGTTFEVNTYRGVRYIGCHICVNGELRKTYMIMPDGRMNTLFSKHGTGAFTNAEFVYCLFPKFAN